MKSTTNDPEHDQNWRWPENTWFRERLNAVKAQEHEQRRKVLAGGKKSEQDSATSSGDKIELELKVD